MVQSITQQFPDVYRIPEINIFNRNVERKITFPILSENIKLGTALYSGIGRIYKGRYPEKIDCSFWRVDLKLLRNDIEVKLYIGPGTIRA